MKQYTIFAADAFPRTASMLRAGDTEFARTRLLKKEEGEVEFLDLANDLTLQGIDPDTLQRPIELLWRSVYANIEDKLFRRWAMHSFQLRLPEISFPEVISVHKYSMGVLYYTGGWLLSSLNKAGGKSPEYKQGLIQMKLESMKELASKHSNEPVPTETANPQDAIDVHITGLYSDAEKAMDDLSSDEMFEIDSDDEADLERDDDDQSDRDDD